MIGYKATDKDGCCKSFKFEVGKTYTKNTPKEELECCTDKVFHFCRELFAIEKESNYKLSESRLFEVIAGDCVRSGDKYGTNSLTIIREIKGEEKLELINSGNCNSGDCNSGNHNSGNWNSGNWNSGNWNSGDWNNGDCNSGNCNSGNYNSGNYNNGNHNSGDCNSGNWNSSNHNSGNHNSSNHNSGDFNSGNHNSGDFNSGDFNSGNHNSGDFNSGDCNSGNHNSGDFNSGDCNSGNHNSGDFNSGDCNSGNWNSGDHNSGNYNSGDCNSGFFNSNEPNVRMFNKDTKLKKDDINIPSWCYFNLTVWVSHDTATEEDKEVHKKEIETCGGFLKTLEYKEAWKLAYDKTNDKQKIQLFNLPNFDADIFEEISGIDVRADYKKLIKV